jgi:hypothetical protein
MWQKILTCGAVQHCKARFARESFLTYCARSVPHDTINFAPQGKELFRAAGLLEYP